MNDSMGSGRTSDATDVEATVATQDDGGLIDVSGRTFDELSTLLGEDNLGRALDSILASGQNGCGYHGFNNRIA